MTENGNGNGNGRFTDLQRRFIDHYVGEARLNKTEAARLAGYSGGDGTPEQQRHQWANQGSRVLGNVGVREEVDRRLARVGATADEALSVLAEQTRSNMAQFLIPGTGVIDWHSVQEYGYLVESVIQTKQGVRLKLYSSQRAAELILKAAGAFKDSEDHDVKLTVVLDR